MLYKALIKITAHSASAGWAVICASPGKSIVKQVAILLAKRSLTGCYIMHVGRKTYATLKVYQGVPKLLVMLATGHQTKAQFNVHLSIDEQELFTP
jgi:hypothetical protein